MFSPCTIDDRQILNCFCLRPKGAAFGPASSDSDSDSDSLMIHLEQVDLLLNAEKTVVLTNEAQPPPVLATDSGLKLTILQRNVGQKWLGCMLTAAGTQLQHIDLQYHLQQASKSFHANRWILLDRSVSISKRLKYFTAVVSSLACFGGGHRAIYNSQLATHHQGWQHGAVHAFHTSFESCLPPNRGPTPAEVSPQSHTTSTPNIPHMCSESSSSDACASPSPSQLGTAGAVALLTLMATTAQRARNQALSDTAVHLWNGQPPKFVGRLQHASPATPY